MKTLLIILLFLIPYSAISQSKYVIIADREVIEASYEIMLQQVGNVEKKSNWGHPFQDYLKSVGINFPAAYCMAGQYYCVQEAAKITGKTNPLKRTGGVVDQWNYFKRAGEKVDYAPAVHNLMFWRNYKRVKGKMRAQVTGHVERIILIGKKGWVRTVGFNTSRDKGTAAQERDGGINTGGVFAKDRHTANPISLLFVEGLGGFKYRNEENLTSDYKCDYTVQKRNSREINFFGIWQNLFGA
jgi:hypothetical protein